MSVAPDEEESGLPPDPRQAEDLAFTRMIARLWVWLCPGAGYAGAGLPTLALVSYSIWIVFYAALAWLLFTIDPVSLWVSAGSFALGLVLWVVEIVLVWFPTSRPPAPRFLVRLPIIATVVIWVGSFAGAGITLVKMSSVVLRGNEMSPTVKDREQVVYLKRVEQSDLKPGTVILFRTSRGPNALMFGRNAAVPGDRIASDGARLIVNGQPGPALGNPLGTQWSPLTVPGAPATLVVPENCYFVCSDNPSAGVDSRMLGWAERDNIISTRVWYLRRDQFLDRVE